MVSEPNFVFGIKQISLANKKDSHVHTAIRSHTCLSAGSGLHSISQPLWLTAVSRSSNQASRDLTYQICANPSIAWWSQHHRRAPRPPMRKTLKSNHSKPSHAPQLASKNSHAPYQNFHSQIFIRDTRCLVGLLIRWSKEPEILAFIWHLTDRKSVV